MNPPQTYNYPDRIYNRLTLAYQSLDAVRLIFGPFFWREMEAPYRLQIKHDWSQLDDVLWC